MPTVSIHGVQCCPRWSASFPPATETNSQQWSQLAFCLSQQDKRGLESNLLATPFQRLTQIRNGLGGGPTADQLGQTHWSTSILHSQILKDWFSPCAGLVETREGLKQSSFARPFHSLTRIEFCLSGSKDTGRMVQDSNTSRKKQKQNGTESFSPFAGQMETNKAAICASCQELQIPALGLNFA